MSNGGSENVVVVAEVLVETQVAEVDRVMVVVAYDGLYTESKLKARP